MKKEKLVEKLYDHLGFNGKDGTYLYVLTRFKEAFGVGTMTLDDFQELDDEFVHELADFVIEHFKGTGLKDKNGKEIQEGDIIKIPVDSNVDFHGEYSLQEVVSVNGQWVTSYIRSETGFKLPRGYTRGFLLDHFEYSPKLFLWSDDYEAQTDAEVIGNIFENPELLEKQ